MDNIILRLKFIRRDPVNEFVTLADGVYCYAVPHDNDIVMLPDRINPYPPQAYKVVGRIWHPRDTTTDVSVVVEPM